MLQGHKTELVSWQNENTRAPNGNLRQQCGFPLLDYDFVAVNYHFVVVWNHFAMVNYDFAAVQNDFVVLHCHFPACNMTSRESMKCE